MWLRDDQFERIEALLPGKVSDPGCTAANNRLFVEAALWIARTGSPWRDLPAEFGPWNSVYQRFARTGGQAGDSPQTLPLFQGLLPGSLSADKAYDTDAIIDYLATNDIKTVIPPRRHRLVQRPFDRQQYKNRNFIERFFCRTKQFRRIATRYDKLAERFASFIALCAAVTWLA